MSHMRGIADWRVPLPGFSNAGGTYDYLIVGAHLTHPIGRTFRIIVGYEAQYQNSNTPFCSGASCGRAYFRNLFTVGFSMAHATESILTNEVSRARGASWQSSRMR